MQPFLLLWLISSALGPAGTDVSRRSYFEILYEPSPRRWPSFLVSFLIHVVLLLALPFLVGTIEPIDESDFWARQLRRQEALRIRVPERLYMSSSGRRQQASPRRTGEEGAAPAAPRAGSVARAGLSRRARRGGARRRFELPPLLRPSQHPQSIFQPELPPDLPLSASTRLPELFFWAPKPPVQLPARVMVVPGYAQAPAAIARLDAPPALELPAEGPGLPLLAPPGPLPVDATDALAVAPRLPLRLPLPELPLPELRSATADTSSGDPVTVLSLSSDPRPLREILVVPRANQLGTAPQGSGGPGEPGPGSARGAGGAAGTAAGSAAGPGQSAGRAPVALNRPQVAAALPSEERAAPEAPSSPTARASLPAAASRLEHPASGVFDVIVESADGDAFPESAGVLSGRPVYSAYLDVGAPREWVLQYCIPGGEAQTVEVAGGVVRLGSPAPLVAPYPRITFRPPVPRRPGVTYVMVHGFLEADGRFDGLRVLGIHGAEDGLSILPVLQQWELRPATQDGRPVRVEILLAIPAG